MNTLSVQQFCEKYQFLVKDLDIHDSYKSVNTSSDYNATPYVQIENNKIWYVVHERGIQKEKRETSDVEMALYWFVCDAVNSCASTHELKNRIHGQDSRRQWMALSVEYMRKIKIEWANRLRDEYNTILDAYPFNDNLGNEKLV